MPVGIGIRVYGMPVYLADSGSEGYIGFYGQSKL